MMCSTPLASRLPMLHQPASYILNLGLMNLVNLRLKISWTLDDILIG